MSSVLVVANPRSKAKKKGHKKLTGAAKAAFLARMNGGRKKSHKPKKKKSHAVAVARENPRPKRKNSFFSIGKVGGHKRKVRRNPINYESSLLTDQLEPALYGAAGAIGTGLLFSSIASKLPANLQTGVPRQLAKAGVAIALGMLGERFLPKDKAQAATIGALTIIAYTAALPYVAKSMPNSNLGKQLSQQLGKQLSGGQMRGPQNALTQQNALGPRGALSGMPGRMPERTDSLATSSRQYQRPANPQLNRAAGGTGWSGSRR